MLLNFEDEAKSLRPTPKGPEVKARCHEADTKVRAKILASRPVWAGDFDITAIYFILIFVPELCSLSGQNKTFSYLLSTIPSCVTTRGQSNLTKSASRGAHSPVRGHPRGSEVVPLNSWGRVSY